MERWVTEVGPIVASGRDGDIFEFGPGRVLRRTKTGRVIEHEFQIMRYLHEQGYPVPEVFEVRDGGKELVMERIEGPIMMDAIVKAPWTLPKYSKLLADLVERLSAIPAPDWLTQMEPGNTFLHIDMHPLNVIMSPSGPVVVDWTNACAGNALTDPAFTYVLLTCPDAPVPRVVQWCLQPLRIAMARLFARRWWGPDYFAAVAACAVTKSNDRAMSPSEAAKCLRLAAKMRKKAKR
jgi:aminoglycoside phosphotransferase (APT) family kinase protein